MNKLLELKELENEVTELLYIVDRPEGLNLCYHSHYQDPTISIFTNRDITSDCTSYSTYRSIVHAGVVFHIEDAIDEQIAKDIIDQIEKVMQ